MLTRAAPPRCSPCCKKGRKDKETKSQRDKETKRQREEETKSRRVKETKSQREEESKRGRDKERKRQKDKESARSPFSPFNSSDTCSKINSWIIRDQFMSNSCSKNPFNSAHSAWTLNALFHKCRNEIVTNAGTKSSQTPERNRHKLRNEIVTNAGKVRKGAFFPHFS